MAILPHRFKKGSCWFILAKVCALTVKSGNIAWPFMLHTQHSQSIDAVTKKANQTTAFLRRNLSSCPKDVKAKCYKSIVLPQLGYALTGIGPCNKSQNSQSGVCIVTVRVPFCNRYMLKKTHFPGVILFLCNTTVILTWLFFKLKDISP